jgi:nitroimidazol reductase NimA-like FMN-containing flavoprotein (pyridoxamine 5'-phosphate oxidase superfamily)
MRNVDMTDDEIGSFLDNHRVLRLATVSENGWPHVAPVGYAHLDDKLYVLSHPEQRKCQNIFHNNRVGAVVDDGDSYTTLRGVFIHGYATVVTEDDLIETVESAWIDHFYHGSLPDVVKAVYSMRDAWMWFEIDPANIVSWDNRKVEESRLKDKGKGINNPFTYHLPDDLGAAAPNDE